MPRMQLTATEIQLIIEHRRKTEIDRTHNAALELTGGVAVELYKEMNRDAPFLPAEFEAMLAERLRKYVRDV